MPSAVLELPCNRRKRKHIGGRILPAKLPVEFPDSLVIGQQHRNRPRASRSLERQPRKPRQLPLVQRFATSGNRGSRRFDKNHLAKVRQRVRRAISPSAQGKRLDEAKDACSKNNRRAKALLFHGIAIDYRSRLPPATAAWSSVVRPAVRPSAARSYSAAVRCCALPKLS